VVFILFFLAATLIIMVVFSTLLVIVDIVMMLEMGIAMNLKVLTIVIGFNIVFFVMAQTILNLDETKSMVGREMIVMVRVFPFW